MNTETKQAMLEIAVNVVFSKHDLSGFEARCRRCEWTAWLIVGNDKPGGTITSVDDGYS